MEEALSVKIKNPKSYTELMDSIPEKDRKCVEIMNKQSAEALAERQFLAQLSQSKSTYLVCFDNGYNYRHISALELYHFIRLKAEYNEIYRKREEYTKSLYNQGSTVISGEEKIAMLRRYCSSLEPQLDAILKQVQLFILPFNREIEKIIDEITNQVVK